MSDDAERYWIISRARSPAFHARIREQIAEEEAQVKLKAVCPPEHYDSMIELAEQRLRESTVRAAEDVVRSMTWREALDSVYQQIIRGELP